MQKFGLKKLGLIALACMTLGATLGALSRNPGLLLFSRVIEGSGMGLIAVMLFFPFRIVGWQIYVYMILQGFIADAVPTAAFAATPEVMKKPEQAGLGLVVVMFGQNLGMFIGPILFGKLVENMSWVAAGYCLIPFSILGFVVGWRLKVR